MTDSAGSLLVRYGLIRPEQLAAAEALRQREGGTIGECLVRLGVVDEERLVDFYHRRLMVPRIDASQFARVSRQVVESVPGDMAAEFRVFPIDVDGEGAITLAMADPSDTHTVDELCFFTDRFCQRAVAPESVIRAAIEQYYGVRIASPHASASVIDPHAEPPPEAAEAPILLTRIKRSEVTPLPAPLPMADRTDLTPLGVDLTSEEQLEEETQPVLPGVDVVELTQRKPAPPALDNAGPILLDRRARLADSKVPTLTGMPTFSLPDPPLARLRATASRAEVAQTVLDYIAQMAPRAAMFVVRAGVLAGFDGRGAIDLEGLKRVQIAVEAPSLFRDVVQSRLPYRGPLPETPANRAFAHLIAALPGDVLLVPIAVRERVIALAYADGLSSALPDAALHAVSREAGLAYERLILAAKR